MLNVTTAFFDVDRNTITLKVVMALMNDIIKAEKKGTLMSGISISLNIRMLVAPRLLAASLREGEIC